MNFDAMGVGETFQTMAGEIVTKVAEGIFTSSDRYGNLMTGDSSWVQSIIGKSNSPFIGGGSLSTSVSWPSPPGLNSAESRELEQLEEEAKQFIKQKKLRKFQALPANLRQEIVDEANIRDLVVALNSENDADFPDIKRLSDLRNRRNGWNHAGSVHIGSMFNYTPPEHFSSRFGSILHQFTTEELAKAHAEMCLEENIQS